jgi:O-antigen/teichoic acid export membrane protein
MTETPVKYSPTRIKIAANTVSQLTAKLLTSGSTFIITFLIARMYGIEGYGDFTKITTFVSVFYLLADFGLNAVYLRDKSDDDVQNQSWSRLLTLRILIALLLMFIVCIILVFLPTGISGGYTEFVKIGIILFAPSILFQALITSANAIFQENLRYDLATLAGAAGSAITLILIWIITLVYLPKVAVNASILAILAGLAVTAITGLIFVSKRFTRISLNFNFRRISSLLFASVPLGATLILNVIYFRADSFIMTLTRPTGDVGIYGLAYKIFEFPLAVPAFFMNSVYPLLLARLKSGHPGKIDTSNAQPLIRKAAILLGASSIIFGSLAWFGAPLVTVIKPEFLPSIAPLRILSLGFPFFFLTGLTMWLLIGLKKQFALIFIYGISMSLNIIANYLLIPRYGYIAASWITVGSEGLILILSLLFLRSSFQKNANPEQTLENLK